MQQCGSPTRSRIVYSEFCVGSALNQLQTEDPEIYQQLRGALKEDPFVHYTRNKCNSCAPGGSKKPPVNRKTRHCKPSC